ncbi:P63C domain-containing protein [Malikia spinosa]|uniref:Bacteriophage Mx8 p63 C-terminal domain-containing protein n=1 Tax=Malikia spinosa TaxID=86180 RepID=A0A7C9ND51_9BURK|nr:P63C domain-containing protein [Malikia spinosa]MYZ53179.1 hypothetical protein [Malikia spinosa]
MSNNDETGKAKGGAARARALTPERRKEIAQVAAAVKKELAGLPRATHGSEDHPLTINGVKIPCYVLEDGRRILTRQGLQVGIGMSASGAIKAGEHRLALFASGLAERAGTGNQALADQCSELATRLANPIRFRAPAAGQAWIGYEATILADLCDAILAGRAGGFLTHQQEHIAQQAEILVRGFARVGIVALVDEATGYQKVRAKDALAKILEAWVAKELQPYVKTFPMDFYEHLFRLRGLDYPPEKQNYRPQYFGVLTNDIVYERLAPGLLEELKKQAQRDAKKAHLHRRLTEEVGHPRLKEHLASVVTVMKLSNDYADFIEKLNRVHPRFGQTYALTLESGDR